MLMQIALIAVLIGAITFMLNRSYVPSAPMVGSATTSAQTAAASEATASSTAATSTPPAATTTPNTAIVKKTSSKGKKSESSAGGGIVRRIDNPYDSAPLSFTVVNDIARSALVNILCLTSGGLVRPISGSGVVIDPRGIILTNAHVAQYVLLADSGKIDLTCYVRTGSPAVSQWIPRVLYIPRAWVTEHAAEITEPHPLGTGEHDYALLYIDRSIDGSALPSSFSAISPDTREAIAFVDDQVLAASYPAEFLGGLAATNNLYAAGSITSIKQLLTFDTDSVDVMSLGGVIEAQSGSSGGAISNQWGRLVGIITTTSEAATTAERDLRGITLSYINRDIKAQTGNDLTSILGGDPKQGADTFESQQGIALADILLKEIFKN